MSDQKEKDILAKMDILSTSGSNPTQAPINTLSVIMLFAELLTILANKQDLSSKRLEKQTNMLILLTIALIILTIILLVYTILLFHITAK